MSASLKESKLASFIRVRCVKCSWNQEMSLREFRRLVTQSNFKCVMCNGSHFKIEGLKPVKTQFAWIDSEEELQYILMIGFLKWGIPVWDCGAESGKCDDPIIIDDIEFQIHAGDFPFFYKGTYKVIELKFITRRCSDRSSTGEIVQSSKQRAVNQPQWELLLDGGGFLVIVMEPPPRDFGIRNIRGETKEECTEKLERLYKQKLANDEIPYEVWVLDQQHFKKLFNEKLISKEGRTEAIFGERTAYGVKKPKSIQRFVNIGRKDLQESVPNCRFQLTKSQIEKGTVTGIILKLMDEKKAGVKL